MITPNTYGGGLPEMELSDVLSAAAMIDGIDIELALSRISGRQNVLEVTLKQTSYYIDEKLRKMAVGLSSGELAEFSIEAHGLKSALAGIGAVKYSELASELEVAAKNGELRTCKEKFFTFAGLMKRLDIELKSVLPAEDAIEKPHGDSKLLLRAAKDAVACLDVYEADDALGCLEKIEAFSFGKEADELIKHICVKIKTFKYDEALLLLRSIMAG